MTVRRFTGSLEGLADNTRNLYAAILAEPGIGAAEAGRRAGVAGYDGAVASLVGRDLIEVKRTEGGTYINTLWPLERRP